MSAAAINRETRAIVGVAVGACTKATARTLWAALPAVYRQKLNNHIGAL